MVTLRIVALLSAAAYLSAQPAVDHHQHLFNPGAAALAPGTPSLDAADLIALLDKAGIQRAVVLSLAYWYANPNRPPVENEYERVKAENDWTGDQVARFPDRLIGFCSVNPLKDYALAEIARCARDKRIAKGLKLHFGNSDVQLDDPSHVRKVRAVFGAANKYRMAVLVHMRASVTRKRPYGEAQARVFLEQILPEAPNVPVQIAHLAGAGGYDEPAVDEAVRVFVNAVQARDRRTRRLLFDVSGIAGLGNWSERAGLVAERIRQLGTDRILYGSDGAVGGNLAPREAWATFRELPLNAQEIGVIEKNVAPYLR
jgi:uncharacterized protein